MQTGQRALYYLRNLVIMVCGATFLKGYSLKQKRDGAANAIADVVDAFCGSETREPMLTQSEFLFDRIKVSTNSSPCKSAGLIKWVEDLRKAFRVPYIALYQGSDLLACTNAYHSLHPTDKQCLAIIKQAIATDQKGYKEVTVFPTHTALSEDISLIGTAAFRFLVFTMPCGVQICILGDSETPAGKLFEHAESPEINDHLATCLQQDKNIDFLEI